MGQHHSRESEDDEARGEKDNADIVRQAQGRVCADKEMRIEIMILDIVQNNQGDKQTAKHLMHWMRQEHSSQFCKEQAQ